MTHKRGKTRRQFLGDSLKGAAAMTVFSIVPRHVLGGPGHRAPSDVITRGVIGCGWRGLAAHVIPNEKDKAPVTLAVCDADKKHLAAAMKKAGRACTAYHDWRKILDRKDIDAIYIATPPHWHAVMSVAAAQAGKDIYCEKPMTRFVAEGRAVVEAVQRYGRVFALGTGRRFGHFYNYGPTKRLRKLVSSGLLGEPLIVRVTPANGFNWWMREWRGRTNVKPRPAPAELDYDMWLGPAPYKPYHPHRVHRTFRGYWDYDGGGLTDMGQHYLDPIQYILGKDRVGPVTIEADGPQPPHPDVVGLWRRATLKYADGTTIILGTGGWKNGREVQGAFLEGPKGRVLSPGKTDPPGLFEKVKTDPDPPALVDFETAIRTRKQSGGGAESSHRSITILHLANVAIRTGRKITWDSVKEQVVGDTNAYRLVDQPLRAPWHL